MLNKIKHIYHCYKLGKHLLNNIVKMPSFEIGDNDELFLRKQSNYIPAYEGTIHTLDCIWDKEIHFESSILIKENEKT